MTRRTGPGGAPIPRHRGSNGPRLLGDELEAPLQAYVRRECRCRSLLHYHTYRSRRSEPGFPDSVIVGPRGVLFRELKSDAGRAEPEQLVWLQRLREAGADAGIWTPQDRRSGRILNALNWLARDRPAPAGRLRAELAKALHLVSRADDEPAADVHGDAGSRHVDHDRWHLHAETTVRTLLAVLPRTGDQVARWLREHRLNDPDPGQVFAALRSDLAHRAAGPP